MNSSGYVSDTAENRASDIHAMFGDPEVGAIIAERRPLLPPAAAAGWGVIRQPQDLRGLVRRHRPDVAIWKKTGLVTFNGPPIMVEMADYPTMPGTRTPHAQGAVHLRPRGIQPSDWWTEELNWDERRTSCGRGPRDSGGWTWLKEQGRGHPGRGLPGVDAAPARRLLAGWEGTVLVLETSEEKPLPGRSTAS